MVSGERFLGFTQCLEAAHAGQLLRGDNDIDWCFDERVQSLAAAGSAMHRIAIAKPGAQVVQGALLAMQQQYLCFELVQRHLLPPKPYVE